MNENKTHGGSEAASEAASDAASDAIPGLHSHSEIACGLLNGVDNLSLWDDEARDVRLVRSTEALAHSVLAIEAVLVRLLDELGRG